MSLPLNLVFETNKKPVREEKLRGGYYTPVPLAEFLAQWAIRTGAERILEPSAGDGNFLLAVADHLSEEASVVAVEIEAQEVHNAQNRLNGRHNRVEWLCGDFFEIYDRLAQGPKFDVTIGNPPFIRFQHFDATSREKAFYHLRMAGYKPTKLANTWVAFVELCMELLAENGRLAMVVPAEILQVKYAGELRSRLSKQFEHIVLVSFRRLVFPEIQQEVVLLLAEGKRERLGKPSDIHTIEFEDGAALIAKGELTNSVAHLPAKHTRNGMKWTALFLSSDAFSALDEAEQSVKLTPLGKLAEVDVGIVTGRNSFFVLPKSKRDALGVQHLSVPIIGRTSALNSILFNSDDFESYTTQHPAYLINLSGVAQSTFPMALTNYILEGEAEEVHKGYKCRIRKRWVDVPSVFVPQAFLYRQIHKYPLLVVNNAGVTSTDTIHRVRIKPNISARLLAGCFFNSLTLAWAEVCGRSYGGGVLELEPREAEELPIPYAEHLSLDIEKVDTLLRQGQHLAALDYVDSVVLKGFLGFDDSMITSIRLAWTELSSRRHYRR